LRQTKLKPTILLRLYLPWRLQLVKRCLLISQLSGVRVLLVDDQEDIRLLVALILSTNGAKVQVCDSADKALVMVKTWKPDVIVSDIVMPEHDGYWFIRHVRLLHPKKGGRIPAVALTALTSTADRARTLTAGFQMHIGKPFIPEDVVSAVEKLTRE
jgi:CheY-like chemotaxis protein